ncbi:MAG TPA: hypothetical protein VGC67_04340 [Cellulomonas sp.]
MSTMTRITGATISAVLALGALTACSSDETPETLETLETLATSPVTTPTPAEVEVSEPTPTETEPAPVADEFSQVIGGQLYPGTEKAPVRIGDDMPGQAPALDSQIADSISVQDEWATALGTVVSSGKYMVSIGPHYNTATQFEGYTWYVIQENQYGNVKVLEKGPVFGSTVEAAQQAFTLDGRTLDRAEYVLILDAR